MQPTVTPQKNILKSLRYNEEKVVEGKAIRIGAENFLEDHERLTKDNIMARFRQRSTFNEHPHDYGIHFSLNFGKSEELKQETLLRISEQFMSGMGFEDQPYVVYQHKDAGHTHLHIVATTAKAEGGWISIKPRHYHAAHAISRELEKEYSLERARKITSADQSDFAVDHAQRVVYGEPGLKHAISDVLNTVFDHYKYTSLDEYNAILRQYNVEANPGQENSRLRKVGGLLYHALDQEGNHIGVPIKASLFLLKPTLTRLEEKFQQNQALRESSRERLTMAINWALAGRAPDWPGFVQRLQKDGIDVVIDKKAGADRLFFVDHVKKCAFAGEALGSAYQPEAIRQRCAAEEQTQQQIQEQRQNIHL